PACCSGPSARRRPSSPALSSGRMATSALDQPIRPDGSGPVPDPAAGGAATDDAGNAHCVEMTQVAKRFGENTVLDHLDLTVGAGEKLVIIGPSGSGKTTIL